MHKELSIIVSIILGLLAIVSLKLDGQKGISLHKITCLTFMLCFSIVPIFIISSGNIVQFIEYEVPLYYSVDMENSNFLYASALSLLGFSGYLLGYKFNKIKNCNTIGFRYHENHKKIRIAGHLFFAISLFSIVAYVYYVGFSNVVLNLQRFRFHTPGQIGVLRRFMPLISVAFLCYYYLSKSRLIKYKALAVTSFIIGLFYYVLINAGRLPLMSFIAIVPMYKILNNKIKISKVKMVYLAIVGVFILLLANPIFDYIAYGKKIELNEISLFTATSKVLLSFSFPYINLLNVKSFTYFAGEFRYFIDFFTWMINIFPSFITNAIGIDKVLSSWEVNTLNYGSQNWGGIPTDIITFGYYQFAYPGVLITTFLYGYIICYFDKIQTYKQPFYTLLKVKLLFFLPFIVMYADFEQIMIARIDYILPIIIFVMINKKERLKTRT